MYNLCFLIPGYFYKLTFRETHMRREHTQHARDTASKYYKRVTVVSMIYHVKGNWSNVLPFPFTGQIRPVVADFLNYWFQKNPCITSVVVPANKKIT